MENNGNGDEEEEEEEEDNDAVQIISDGEDTENRCLKRKNSSPGEAKANKMSNKTETDTNDDEEGQLCPICFDTWTTSGIHRLTSLKCGHLFGFGCVKRWLNTQFPYRCPTCNSKAKKSDLRFIFARKLVAVDNSEVVRLNEQLEAEREAKRRAELDIASVRLLYQQVTDDCERYKNQIEDLKRLQYAMPPQAGVMHASSSKAGAPGKTDEQSLLTFERKVNICDQAVQARLLACETRLGVVAVAVPSTSDLFPGYGIRKVSSVDWRSGQFVPLHSKTIKDIATKPSRFADGYLLSAALDGNVKVTSLSCNVPVVTYSAQNAHGGPLGVWSCSWHSTSSFYFYAGYQNGTVRLFDLRKSDQHIRELPTMGSNAPVVSLQHINRAGGINSFKGLVVGQLDRITFYEETSSDPAECNGHVLQTEGGLVSMFFEQNTEHLLATFRPSAQSASSKRIRHHVCSLEVSQLLGRRSVTLSVRQTIHGGRSMKLMSRNCLFPVGSTLYLLAGDEEAKGVCVWDVNADKLKQKIELSNAIVSDVMCVGAQESSKLLALDDGGKLSIFRLNNTNNGSG